MRRNAASSSRIWSITLCGFFFNSGNAPAISSTTVGTSWYRNGSFVPSTCITVAFGAAKDALQHVVAADVADGRAIGERERERADVVRDDAVRGVLQVVDHAAVRPVAPRHASESPRTDWREHVGVVVAVLPLNHRADALEAHAGIDVLCWQRREALIFVAVELDEDEVPDFDDLVRAAVNERAAASVRRAVDVNFGTRAARPGVAHLPEVVLLVAEMNVRFRHAHRLPEARRFVVARNAGGLVALEDGDVQGASRRASTPR